ncbi:hypothetical protein [Dactylosporangium sp. NPDC051484]|uniref:hypothetical protein n=1 Tax=Dactylosporangium sp. NPDC051484 TaxID=3154942 RepID=UPI00344CF725
MATSRVRGRRYPGGYAATPAASTASESAKKIAGGITGVPADLAGLPAATATSANAGAWKIGCTGSQAPPSTRTTPSSEPVPHAAPWLCCPNLVIDAYRLAGRADIDHDRRDPHDRVDVFAVHGVS